jgi:hypothetical protein
MNAIENSIYNDGTVIETKIFHDEDNNVIKHEFVECDGLTYEFSFFNGEFINITRI